MATQDTVIACSLRQLASRINLPRQIAGRSGAFVAARSLAVLAPLALLAGVGCAEDVPFDPAACEAPAIFRIERVTLPNSTIEALALGLDVNGDDEADNALGVLLVAWHIFFHDVDLEATVRQRLANEVDWKLALRPCGDRFSVALGRPEQLNEHHFISKAGAMPPPDPAQSGAEPLVVRGDGAELPLSLLFDPGAAVSSPGWLPVSLGALRLAVSTDGERVAAKLSGSLDRDAAFATMVPPLARFFDTYQDPTLLELFDADEDGHVTEADIHASETLHSLTIPDLEVGGEPALSLGLELSGVREP